MKKTALLLCLLSFFVPFASVRSDVASPVPQGVIAAYLNIFPNTDLAKIEVIAQGVGANGTSYWCIYAANKDVDGESGTDTEGAVELSPDGKGKMISAGHYASTPICYVKDKVALKELQDSYAKKFFQWCGGEQNLLKENAGQTRAARMTYDLAAGLLRMGLPLRPETLVGSDGIDTKSLRPLKSYPELAKLLSEQK